MEQQQFTDTITQYWDSGTVITVTITQYWDKGTLLTRSPRTGTVAQWLVTIIQYWDSGTLLSRSPGTGTVAQWLLTPSSITGTVSFYCHDHPVRGQWHSDYCHDHPVLGQLHFTDMITLCWDSGTVITVTITQYWDNGTLLKRSPSIGTVALWLLSIIQHWGNGTLLKQSPSIGAVALWLLSRSPSTGAMALYWNDHPVLGQWHCDYCHNRSADYQPRILISTQVVHTEATMSWSVKANVWHSYKPKLFSREREIFPFRLFKVRNPAF